MTVDEAAAGGAVSLLLPPGAAGRWARPLGLVRRLSWRPLYVGVLAVILVLVVWILVKAVVPLDGVSIAGIRILPRTDNGSLPSPLSVLKVLGQPEVNIPGSQTTGITILDSFLFSLKLTAIGFGVGILVGTLLGVLMYLVKFAERGLLPYLLVVPTVPIVVVAPLIAAWSGRVVIFGQPWEPWMTVSLISAGLSFWPISAGLVRGLNSPSRESRDLMHCLAASPRDLLLRLSLPSAVPYLLPALRISAAAAVVSVIVSEISTGTAGGIGALILGYIPEASYDGSRLFAAVIAAGLLGITMVSAVAALEFPLRKYQERHA